MFPIPAAAEPLVCSIRCAFTRRTFDRFVLLMAGLIVTMGRRTVSHALRIIDPQLDGHWCNYHRLYSQARSMWKLGGDADPAGGRDAASGVSDHPGRRRHRRW